MKIARLAISVVAVVAACLPAGCKRSQSGGVSFSKIATAFQASWLMPEGMAEDPSAKPVVSAAPSSVSSKIQGVARCSRQFSASEMSARVDEFIRSTMAEAGAKNITVKEQASGKSFGRQISYQHGDNLGQIVLLFSFSSDGKTANYDIYVQEASKSKVSGKGG